MAPTDNRSAPDRSAGMAGEDLDTDADPVYRAEESASAQVPLRRFSRFVAIEAYVESLVTSTWWSESFSRAPLEVVIERRSANATFSAARIQRDDMRAESAPPDAPGSGEDGMGVIWIVDGRGWGLETVLHELAHLASGTRAGHGAAFRSALGKLWRHEAGIEAWAALQAGFRSVGLPDAARPDGSPRPPRLL